MSGIRDYVFEVDTPLTVSKGYFTPDEAERLAGVLVEKAREVRDRENGVVRCGTYTLRITNAGNVACERNGATASLWDPEDGPCGPVVVDGLAQACAKLWAEKQNETK